MKKLLLIGFLFGLNSVFSQGGFPVKDTLNGDEQLRLFNEPGGNKAIEIRGIGNYVRDSILFDSLFTPQSVIFAGDDGSLSEDTARFFYDSSINRLTINTNSNSGGLYIQQDHGGSWYTQSWNSVQGWRILNYENIIQGAPTLYFHRGRNDGLNNGLPLIDNDYTAMLTGYAVGPNGTGIGLGNWLRQEVDGVSTANNRYGLNIVMRATDTVSGGASGVDRLTLSYNTLRLHNYTNSRIDTSSISNFLYTDANGHIQSQPVDSLAKAIANVDSLYTPGSVIFVDSNGGLSELNPYFFYDTARKLVTSKSDAYQGGFRSERTNTLYRGYTQMSSEDFTIGTISDLTHPTFFIDKARNDGAGNRANLNPNDFISNFFFRSYHSGSYSSPWHNRISMHFLNQNGAVAEHRMSFILGNSTLLQLNGQTKDISFNTYQPTRNDATSANNFLYTTTGGVLQSKSLDSIVMVSDTMIIQNTDTLQGLRDYDTTEHWTGQRWYDGKKVYRRVIPNVTFASSLDLSPYFSPNYIYQIVDMNFTKVNGSLTSKSSFVSYSYDVSINQVTSAGISGATGGNPWDLIITYTKQ